MLQLEKAEVLGGRSTIIINTFRESMVHYELENRADKISILTNDMRIIYDDYYTSIFTILFYGLMMVFALGMYAYISPILLIVVLLLTAVPFLLPSVLNRQLKARRMLFSDQMADYTANIRQLLDGYETIYAFQLDDKFSKIHQSCSQAVSNKEYRFQKLINQSVTLTSFLSNVTFLAMLCSGMLLVFQGTITLGYMVAATNLSNFVIIPVQNIVQCLAKLRSTKPIRNKMMRLMNENRDIDEEAAVITTRISNIKVQNLSFSYDAKPLLKNVSLEIKSGEKIAITGRSGCGKSTLVKLIYKYYSNYQGDIWINGLDLKQIGQKSLYAKAGYISQKSFLFEDTIKNNICLYEDFSDADLAWAISQAGLEPYVESLPKGVDTMIYENGANLSGGQIQRIALARLIIRRYEVLIADEITANLAHGTGEEIMNHLLSMDAIVIVITHNTSCQYMNRFHSIYCLADGYLERI